MENSNGRYWGVGGGYASAPPTTGVATGGVNEVNQTINRVLDIFGK